MNVNETKSMIKKLIKYSICELETAECYQELMMCVEDSSAFTKFKEFANQELIHYEYDFSTAMSLAQKLKDAGEISNVDELISCVYKENETDWKDKIVWKIANTKPKTTR